MYTSIGTRLRELEMRPRADSLSASEYESGFRAGEREPLRTSRARARAFFRGVFYTPSVNVTRTLHVRNNARNNFATTSSLRSCGPELSGERFFACALRALFGRVLVACALALRSPAISGGSVVPGGLVLHLAWPSHCSSWSTSSGGQVPPHTSKKMDYIRDCASQDELHS